MASTSSRPHRSSYPSESSKTYNFNGTSRTLVKWYPLGKDANLWLDGGNCLVKLAASPVSSYALKIPFETLASSRNGPLLAQCRTLPRVPGEPKTHTLSIPPSRSFADPMLPYELTARNYFAFLFEKPLISTRLGPAMIELWDLVQEWHLGDESMMDRLLNYYAGQGYLHAANNPHAACAALALADHVRRRDIWSNAFAHCVAMCARLEMQNPEYASLSNTTRALITRAALEMETRIASFSNAVGSLLDTDFSTEHLGLTKPARDHLDRFRSFLLSFFVEKLEYFPPSVTADHFNVSSWDEVRADFQNLYDYLADRESSQTIFGDRGVTGGVCVRQNVQAFDSRHSFSALPHPLPLLPSLTPVRRMTESQVSLRSLKLIRLESDFRPSSQESLVQASNSHDAELLANPVIQQYVLFERQKLQEKISLAEARKVRWLLVYGCLQMLNSILTPAAGVLHAAECVYPLCVSLSSCPIPEKTAMRISTQLAHETTGLHSDTSDADAEDADHISIRPDCEADNAHEYFTLSRRGSQLDTTLYDMDQNRSSYSVPNSPIARTLSIKSMTALSKSVVGGLSRRNSSRKSLTQMPRKMPSFCDIVVETVETKDSEEAPEVDGVDQDLADFDFGLEMPTIRYSIDENVKLQEQRRGSSHAPHFGAINEQDEPFSPSSDTSRRSSACSSDCETPNTEPSSRSNSTRESRLPKGLARLDEDCVLETDADTSENLSRIYSNPSTVSLSAGCYTPTGMVMYDVPVSKFAALTSRPQRTASNRAVNSDRLLVSHIDQQRRGRIIPLAR